ncbi:hypothetical protein GLOIN_2v1841751 [Rhizophagus irregularis DAOM 181602=DAOM 197198]|uniref:SAM domain-containing protein n=1 Tax=Rhizophagus irregularis (strain DAOM 181602 / DAOM 197198 / MUCL 43194) TaxID=747089 RepID=A0A2P4PYI8_RHIID|nr:hypothetical protein GLOIN_2v1841751 [Rhizophagus irregularis DAOM 181602=DAOM 197198]POG70444.1 hypothetical protein GLOIN_2v1841751 [Rhizophagus irregularis DAOM 181602=DAOM 197198]|eukprot:XP_025177310.1 hypothetical protein GLOIN_2v1841751 [Rhizophagus irregularis DAOM 181602=DAOM 197198]
MTSKKILCKNLYQTLLYPQNLYSSSLLNYFLWNGISNKFLTFKRTLSITKKIDLIISSQILKITSPYLKFNKKPQIKNPYYFQVKNWTSEEVNQFLKERMGDNWTTELKKFFEKHKVTGSELFMLNNYSRFSELYAKEIGITYNLRKIISQLYTKTIYIQDYFSNDYIQTDIHDDLEFFEFLKKAKGKGFVSINDNNKIPEHIISLKDLQHNQYYYIIKDCYSQKELDKYIYPHHILIHSNKKIKEFKYWSSEEVIEFLKKEFDNHWTTKVEYYFKNMKFTGNHLSKLNLNNILNYDKIFNRFLPIMTSIKFQEIICQLQGYIVEKHDVIISVKFYKIC